MHLHTLDWVIIVVSTLICFVPALFFGKRSGKNTSEFFASGRSVPWWLAGLSMVATTFSSDTPNLVANFVRTQGVAGNWQWWAFTLTGVATVFFYARLWRRSGVLTDLEFYELRYSGKAAGAVRGFRAVYLGFFFNIIIMASVNLAACKIAAVLFGFQRWQTLLAVGVLNVVFAAHSGLWGVLVIDMIQFFIKMSAVIAAAYFAVKLPQVGGLSGLVEKLSHTHGPGGVNYLSMLPDFSSNWDLAIAVFIMPMAVQWWAVWYPGAEPGGGSYIAQRMLASKSEKDALGATLFFNVAHYVLRPWPWIITALASLIIYPQLSDIRRAFPNLDPTLVGHDIAFPAMLLFLPVGWMGLMVGGLIAANSSTILTHLNWGASYLVHDFYRRFLRPGQSEKHYVFAGRMATILLFFTSSGAGFLPRNRAAELQHHAPGGGGHRAALPDALVLVAHHRVVRDRGYGELVRGIGAVPDPDKERGHHRHLPAAPDHRDCDHHQLGDHGIRRTANRYGGAGELLQESAPVRPRLAGDPPQGRHLRRGSGDVYAAREHPAGAGGLADRVCDDLVFAIRGRQLPVRANGLHRGVDGGVPGERRDSDPGREPPVELSSRRGTSR